MTIELDHLFIASQINAPELEQLIDFGLMEGRSNVHPGQGTANRCIFFKNFMFELLFVVDKEDVCSPVVSPIHLKERCNYRQTQFSPFGIAFRRQNEDKALPFPTWKYKPPYLPEHLQIDIAENIKPDEPLLFVVPFKKKNHTQPINHPVGIQRVTGVEITIPSSQPFSDVINTINGQDLVRFTSGADNLVILECDRLIQQQERDFRPHLPLIIQW